MTIEEPTNNYSTIDMTTHFEKLSNELLLDIFDYINPRQLYNTFWNLNSRLNNLFVSIKHLQLIVDKEEDEEVIALLAPHIGLLQVNTWDEIDLRGFSNLYSLTLARPSLIQLKQIRPDIMLQLTYLSLFSNVYFSAPKQLIIDAFSNRFPCLRWARLGHLESIVPFCELKSFSLRYLHIGGYHTTIIPFILGSCPKLEHLHVDFLRQGDKIMLPPPVIDNHPLQQFILRDYCRLASYADIRTVITYIPNTKKIELKCTCRASFISLIQHLSNHLSQLRRFDCYITELPIDSSTNLTMIRQVHPCFNYIECRTQGADFRIFDTQR